jgi:thioester reductase-like protein
LKFNFGNLLFFLFLKLFETVSKAHSDFRSKLVPVKGDLSEPDLGLSLEERQMLVENVNVVFHSAATIKFDEPIK